MKYEAPVSKTRPSHSVPESRTSLEAMRPPIFMPLLTIRKGTPCERNSRAQATPVIPAPTIRTGRLSPVLAKTRVTLNKEFGDPNYFVGFPNSAGCTTQVLKATQKPLVGNMTPRNRTMTLPTVAPQRI